MIKSLFGIIALGIAAVGYSDIGSNISPNTLLSSSPRLEDLPAPKYEPTYKVPSYGYWSTGWLSSLWSQKGPLNLNTSLGLGRKFIVENQHALVLEALGSHNSGSISTAALKTGYHFRFQDHPDISSAYIGTNFHYGVMHLGERFCQPLEEAYREANPGYSIRLKRNHFYARPEFVLGYEFRDEKKALKFFEVGYKLADPSSGPEKILEPNAFAVTWGTGF